MIDNLPSIWTTGCLLAGDAVLGWLLQLPRDIALLALAALTAGLMLLLRRWASDQQALSCMQHDNRRLAQLTRDARRGRQRELLVRYRRTRSRIAGMRIVAESRLAVLSLLPLAGVVSWGAARLQYFPPAAGEPLDWVVYAPASSVGDVIHLVPSSEVDVRAGWVRELEIAELGGSPRGRASWSLRARRPRTTLRLTTRLGSRTAVHPVMIGESSYLPPVVSHGGDLQSSVRLETYKPFGWLPALPGLAPWLVGYIAVLLAMFFAAKRMLGVS